MNWALIFGGAIGGITPFVGNALTVDAAYLETLKDPVALTGYVVLRIAVLMFLGGLAVAIQDVGDFRRAVQVGMLGPALLTGYLNGANVKPIEPAAKVEWSIVSEAHADRPVRRPRYRPAVTEPVTAPTPKPLPTPVKEDSVGERLWRGFTGERSHD